jgi:hypothetical protein
MLPVRKAKPKANKRVTITVQEHPYGGSVEDKLEIDLQLMHGIIRSPLGTNPARDKKIMAAWRSKD